MRTGNLRRTLTIQRQTRTQDAVGQPVETWTTLVQRRGSIEPLNGREYLNASGEGSDTSTRIRMRYDSVTGTAKPFDRIVDESVSPMIVYDIESVVNPRERNRELVFMCRRL